MLAAGQGPFEVDFDGREGVETFLAEIEANLQAGERGAYAVPPALEPYLPENDPFTFNKVTFAWITITLPHTNNRWQGRNLGILMMNYSARRDLAEPMQAHAGIDAIGSSTSFSYLIPG